MKREDNQRTWFPGVAFVGILMLGFLLVYPVHIPISYFETDFIDYCVGIEALDHLRLKTPYKRSGVAAWLPYIFSKPLGIVNGLAVTSIVCYAIISGIALRWVQRIHSTERVFWIVGVLILCSGPLLSLSRMLNFYPVIVLVLFWGAYQLYRLFDEPTVASTVLATVSAVGAFVIDVRGLFWGLWYVACIVGVLILMKRWKLLIVHSVVLASGWPLGRLAYHNLHSPLSRQMDVRPLYHVVDKTNPLYAKPYDYPEGFLWGRSSFGDLWEELVFVWHQTRLPVPEGFYKFSVVSSDVQLYWWALCLLLLSVGVYGVVKKRNAWWKSVVPMVPFLLTFWKLPDVVEPHIRFYAQVMPIFVVLLALPLVEVFKDQSNRKVAVFSVLMIAVCSVAVPKWGVSRVILQAHLKMSLPEAEQVFDENDIGMGYEVHLYTSPMTQQERFLESSWFEYCNTRLKEDTVLVPFYQRIKQ